MVAMVIETHAGGRLLDRANGSQQFELQFLVDLLLAHQHAAASEEWITRSLDAIAQAQRIRDGRRLAYPALAKRLHAGGRSDEHIFAHAERLQPIDVARGFAAKAIAGDIELQAAGGKRTSRGGERVDRIAGRRRQNQIARRQSIGPFAARLEALERRADGALVPANPRHAAQEMRKALQIARLLDQRPAHHRWEPIHLSSRLAVARDQTGQRLDNGLVFAGACVDAVDACGMEQSLQQFFGRGLGEAGLCDRHNEAPV